MSRKGNCWDNAVAESFFHTLKVELTSRVDYKFHVVAVGSISHWIENFYNTERLHSTLDYSSPVEYEEIHKCSLANFK